MSIFKKYYDLWSNLSAEDLKRVEQHERQIDITNETFTRYKNDYIKRIELMYLPKSEQPETYQIDKFLKRYLAVELLKKENKKVRIKLWLWESPIKIAIIVCLLIIVIICIIIFFTVPGYTSQLVSGLIGIISGCFIGAAIFLVE